MPPISVPNGAPNQCQGSYTSGQCRHPAEPGDTLCKGCGGVDRVAQNSRRQYMLANSNYAQRLTQLAEHEDIKSLREEIAIARMMLERRFNMIKDSDAELLAACGPINMMLGTIERLVKTSHQIETNLGVVLTRNTVLKLAQVMVEIVMDEIQSIPNYEEIIDRISARLISAITNTTNNNDDTRKIEAIDVEFEHTPPPEQAQET